MVDAIYRVPKFEVGLLGPNPGLSLEQHRVVTHCSEIMTALEEAGSALLKSEPERREALKRIKDLYFKVTGWQFIALPPLPQTVIIDRPDPYPELQEYIATEGDTDGLA